MEFYQISPKTSNQEALKFRKQTHTQMSHAYLLFPPSNVTHATVRLVTDTVLSQAVRSGLGLDKRFGLGRANPNQLIE